MIQYLIKLSNNLAALGFSQESQAIKAIIKTALPSINEQRTKLYSSPEYQKFIFKFLQDWGLSHTFEAATYLLNAPQYLKEGITDKNLFLAGLSIASIIPGLEELKLGFDFESTPEELKALAALILKEQGRIQSILNRIKESKFQAQIKKMIPDGELLITHADRIWAAMRQWAFLQEKEVIPESEEPMTDLNSPENPLNQF